MLGVVPIQRRYFAVTPLLGVVAIQNRRCVKIPDEHRAVREKREKRGKKRK